MTLFDIEREAIRQLHLVAPFEKLLFWVRAYGVPEQELAAALHTVWPEEKAVLSFIQGDDLSLAAMPMEAEFWDIRSSQDIYATTILDMANAQVFQHLLHALRRYVQAFRLTLPGDVSLSKEAFLVYGLFLEHYLHSGYASSGSMSPAVVQRQIAEMPFVELLKALEELKALGLLQRRDTSAEAYELPEACRTVLVSYLVLLEKWQKNDLRSDQAQIDKAAQLNGHGAGDGEGTTGSRPRCGV